MGQGLNSAAFFPVSRNNVFSPDRVRIKWISTPGLKPEPFEQADAVNRAARAGDPDHYFQIRLLGRNLF